MDCKHCRSEIPSDRFRCLNCGMFTVVEEKEEPQSVFASLSSAEDTDTIKRITRKRWWASALGGGIVLRQSMLIGGEPGAGKSTVSLMIAEACALEMKLPALIIPTEEDVREVKARVVRLGLDTDCFEYPLEAQDETLECLNHIEESFSMVVVDSVPDLIGTNLNDAVHVLKRLKAFAMDTDTPILAVDHVNKGEELAGLLRQQFQVDSVIYLRNNPGEDERYWTTIKNRFGQGNKVIELLMRQETAKFPGLLYPKPDSEINEETFKKRAIAKPAKSFRKAKARGKT